MKRIRFLVALLFVLVVARAFQKTYSLITPTRNQHGHFVARSVLKHSRNELPRPRAGILFPRQAAVDSFSMDTLPAEKTTAEQTILEVAQKYLRARSTEIGLRVHHTLKPTVHLSPIGPLVVYQIYQDELPLIGMRIEIRLNRDLELVDAKWDYKPIPHVEIHDEVIGIDELSEFLPQGVKILEGPPPHPIVYAPPFHNFAEYAFAVPVIDRHGIPSTLIVRASDGMILGGEGPRREGPRISRPSLLPRRATPPRESESLSE
jgi:hypothetical protein